MTNAMIIEETKKSLGLKDVKAHTFSMWKALGFQVKKGEKAKFSCLIWKAGSKKIIDTKLDGSEEEKKLNKMFRKLAYFFTEEQVEPIK